MCAAAMDMTLEFLAHQLFFHSKMFQTMVPFTGALPYYCIFVPQSLGTSNSSWWDGLCHSSPGTVHIYYLCPVTLTVAVDQEGTPLSNHELELSHDEDWIETLGPAMVFALHILPAALAVGHCTNLPLWPVLETAGSLDDSSTGLEARLNATLDLKRQLVSALTQRIADRCPEKADDGEDDMEHDGEEEDSSTVIMMKLMKRVLESNGSPLETILNDSELDQLLEGVVESLTCIAHAVQDPEWEHCGLVPATSNQDDDNEEDGECTTTTCLVSLSAKALYEACGHACFSTDLQFSTSELYRELQLNNLSLIWEEQEQHHQLEWDRRQTKWDAERTEWEQERQRVESQHKQHVEHLRQQVQRLETEQKQQRAKQEHDKVNQKFTQSLSKDNLTNNTKNKKKPTFRGFVLNKREEDPLTKRRVNRTQRRRRSIL